ncbi:restriction endonuclease subunit S [uncultured Streptococcus sp.]|uniref:restriction endonuclease subunit S n=1 Tax=uncultured Streptococcus sp. TaxID=83427 RepID=UPI0025942159|nr:restriction endonuclease subunit S [uncultured Streptococcus sp.]
MTNKVPNIRFKGFTDDWEQRKFGEVVTIERGGSPRPIDKFITKDVNGLNWVKIGDAPEQGNYITKTAEKIKPEGLSKTREVHPGDLILSNSMSFGKPYIMAIDGCIHDGWLAIRDTKKIFELRFLCTLLGTGNMLNQYKAMAAGSTVNNLNKELVGGTTVLYPTIEEQTKIGEYFSNLDHLITLHQRKCEQTKELKKFMLQKMFPKKGEKNPEIRFPGFTDDWEQRKLGELLNETRNKTTVEDEDTLLSCAIDGMFLNSELFSHFRGSSNIGYLKVKKNDLILSAQNLHLGNCNVNLRFEHGIISPAYKVYELIECNPLFMQAWVKQDKTKDFFLKASTEGASVCRKNIIWEELYKQKLPVPKVIEQQKIGEYFSNLDNLITLHQRKCEQLKELKKFMLQNMFPKKG